MSSSSFCTSIFPAVANKKQATQGLGARTDLVVIPRVDKQECATPGLSCTSADTPRPRRNFLFTSPFFRETRILPQSSVRARAGHRPCSVKPSQVHEGKLSKRLAARASSKRLRQQKIPPWANPSASCTLLFIHSWQVGISANALRSPSAQVSLAHLRAADKKTHEHFHFFAK